MGHAARRPAANSLTASVVSGLPPIPHSPLLTSKIFTHVTPRIYAFLFGQRKVAQVLKTLVTRPERRLSAFQPKIASSCATVAPFSAARVGAILRKHAPSDLAVPLDCSRGSSRNPSCPIPMERSTWSSARLRDSRCAGKSNAIAPHSEI